MSLPFSLQPLSSQLNTPFFTSPIQFTNHRDTTVVSKTKNQLPTCNHHGLLLFSSPYFNQCRSPLLQQEGGAILKLSLKQGLAATYPANLVPPCLVCATENKIDPKTFYKTNKKLRNSWPGPSNGNINALSPQQGQVRCKIFARFFWHANFQDSIEMKTASKEEHDHVLLEKKSLNDHLNQINEEINEIKNHADILKGELDKFLSYSNSAIRTADQSYVVKRDKNEGRAKEEADNSSGRGRITAEDMFGNRSHTETGRKRRGSPDDTDIDTRSAKRTRQD